MTIVFAGSFLEYSSWILKALHDTSECHVIGVLTTPPQPIGKQKTLQKTPVHLLADSLHIPTLTPDVLDDQTLQEVESTFGKPDLLVTAGYGKLLPPSWLSWPKTAALNLHFSLLPSYRGANPAEWALLLGETKTGVTLIEMSPAFDTGKMVATATTAITTTDTRETLYEKLYQLGAKTLPGMLQTYMQFRKTGTSSGSDSEITSYLPPIDQPTSPTPFAARFKRDDAFVDWVAVEATMNGESFHSEELGPLLQKAFLSKSQPASAAFIEKAVRALAGFPSLWAYISTTKGKKRMKILSASLQNNKLQLEKVQIEGQSPALWNQVKNSVIQN